MIDTTLPLHQQSPTLRRFSPRKASSPRSPTSSPYGPVGRRIYSIFFWMACLMGTFLFVSVFLQPAIADHTDGLLLFPRNGTLPFTINDVARIIEATKVTLIAADDSGDVLYDDEVDGMADDDAVQYSSEEASPDQEISEEYEDDLIDVADRWVPMSAQKVMMQLEGGR